ncbi:ABC transporter substrate-binding protein [Streptomyces sp. NPDC101455]|uniref:ABC transporter substrate-binding protein n=1 Tax=Streptomyces sp. NPDC101455 TaxID=3366142 RepID=UPI0037F9D1C5
MLATSWTSDSTASVWTFRLREGVTWHDGTDFTSADVLYSLTWMAKPGNGLALNVADVDLDKVSAQGPYTVVVPLKSPNLLFPYSLATASIVRRGAEDFTRPVGTGPFSFVSLDPGQQAVRTRNPAYWDPGKPYLDELVFLSVKDDFARLNALLSGQTDVMAQVPFTQAKSQLVGDVRLIRSPGVTAQAFYMATDKHPFDDVRVRRALRLVVDRRQLVEVALFGFGTVGNDLYGKGLEYYDGSLPQRTRERPPAGRNGGARGHPPAGVRRRGVLVLARSLRPSSAHRLRPVDAIDHDRHPAVFKAPCTGHTIELSAFSRLRPINDKNSGTVLG